MSAPSEIRTLPRRTARLIFRHHLENGALVSARMALVVFAAWLVLGEALAVYAAIGALCLSVADQPIALASRIRVLVAGIAAGGTIMLLVGLSSGNAAALGAVVLGVSLYFALALAFGRQMITLGVSGILAMIITMAIPAPDPATAFERCGLFLSGGLTYAALALATGLILGDRVRAMALNEVLLALAGYLRARADLYDPGVKRQKALAGVIERHGALMERLQTARDLIFTGRPTAHRRRWIHAMLAALDLYEAVLSSDSDWETLREAPDTRALSQLSALSRALADDVEELGLSIAAPAADEPEGAALRHPDLMAALDAALARMKEDGQAEGAATLAPTRTKMARALRRAERLAEALRLPPGQTPDLPDVALAAFVQPPFSWRETLRGHLAPRSPSGRYAIRLTLAMMTGYAITVALPGYVHGGWILLTVALIMRASYAVTRQRRNDRLVGTLLGCAAAAVLIPVLPHWATVGVVILGLGIVNAFATTNYRVASFAASLLALMLLQYLEPQTYFVAERLLDTLIGAGLSMTFARVLPSWERNDIPRLVTQLAEADRTFADQALRLAPEDQTYRLARKAALDRFTALATTVRRLSSEPDRENRRFVALNELLAADYLLASDLASVHAMIQARGEELDPAAATPLLEEVREGVVRSLSSAGPRPPTETLRRRGWFELHDPSALTALRRRLLHIEHSAQRLAAQVDRLGG
ncbi:FUSC family protein [Acidimangrovimonas sediminis]|uniref:FUSC family protein n=1 Tax=Acidimangrovimonas sediminis TaxID=2056283 RepID=UPI000C80DDE8|nr:FUSC family membrane protein [Acidimangrovimonas sediminis]